VFVISAIGIALADRISSEPLNGAHGQAEH
jgi:hypothetical protein